MPIPGIDKEIILRKIRILIMLSKGESGPKTTGDRFEDGKYVYPARLKMIVDELEELKRRVEIS